MNLCYIALNGFTKKMKISALEISVFTRAFLGRSVSWRDGDGGEERSGPPERGNRGGWHDGSRGMPPRRSWDDDNLPEWATENLTEGGGTFDSSGAFHGSDDEQVRNIEYLSTS